MQSRQDDSGFESQIDKSRRMIIEKHREATNSAYDDDEYEDARYDSVTEVDEYSEASDFSYHRSVVKGDEENLDAKDLEKTSD